MSYFFPQFVARLNDKNEVNEDDMEFESTSRNWKLELLIYVMDLV